MFEDLIKKPEEETPNLDICCYVWNQEQCEHYKIYSGPVGSKTREQSGLKTCDHFGQLSQFCYRRSKSLKQEFF